MGAYLETHGHIKHVEVCADFIDFVPIAMTIPAIQAKGATVARVDAHLLTTKPSFFGPSSFLRSQNIPYIPQGCVRTHLALEIRIDDGLDLIDNALRVTVGDSSHDAPQDLKVGIRQKA